MFTWSLGRLAIKRAAYTNLWSSIYANSLDMLDNVTDLGLSGSLVLYFSLGALVFLLALAFLTFTGYLHYVHWKYSHIPQPKRPRYIVDLC